MVRGTAEIFGAELAPSRTYKFSNCHFAVFTWHGCTLSVEGVAQAESYVAGETPMASYINTHAALLNMRKECMDTMTNGPRVRVILSVCSRKLVLDEVLSVRALFCILIRMFFETLRMLWKAH